MQKNDDRQSSKMHFPVSICTLFLKYLEADTILQRLLGLGRATFVWSGLVAERVPESRVLGTRLTVEK